MGIISNTLKARNQTNDISNFDMSKRRGNFVIFSILISIFVFGIYFLYPKSHSESEIQPKQNEGDQKTLIQKAVDEYLSQNGMKEYLKQIKANQKNEGEMKTLMQRLLDDYLKENGMKDFLTRKIKKHNLLIQLHNQYKKVTSDVKASCKNPR